MLSEIKLGIRWCEVLQVASSSADRALACTRLWPQSKEETTVLNSLIG